MQGNHISGNFFFDGVAISGNNNIIGGTVSGAGNLIESNRTGVVIRSGTGNSILSNSIYSNSVVGIGFPGIVNNDTGDADTGPNNLQNFPVLSSAMPNNDGTTTVQGTLNSASNTTFYIEFFANTICHHSGYGEGQAFIGHTTVTTDGSGNSSFTFSTTVPVSLGQSIAATATDPAGNTSGFSACRENRAPGSLQFSAATYSFAENGGTATITVTRTGGSDGAVSVSYTTSNGTAIAGSDYTPRFGTLYFNNEVTSQSFTVPLTNDSLDEAHETINLTLSNATNGATLGSQSTAVLTVLDDDDPTPGSVLISEFRFRGSNGSLDEFIELYNNTNSDIIVSTTDGSDGWALVASDGAIRQVIPNNKVIKARSHYLCVNSTDPGGYSLGPNQANSSTAVAGDIAYTTEIADNTGIALFRTANPANFTTANRLDAVGFSTLPAESLFFEGTPLPAIGTLDGEYSLVRKTVTAGGLANTGRPQDTDNNANDFLFISTTSGSFDGNVASVLGAPGPENLSSPIQRNAQIRAILLDPAQGPAASANRYRYRCTDADVPAPCEANTAPLGYLSIRRTYTNNTGQPVTRLRFRIVDITTSPEGTGANGLADLRALSRSGSFTVTLTATGQSLTVQGLMLEQPPTQPSGGGYNSTLATPSVTLQTPLSPTAPNNRIRVEFLLGIVQGGNFRFLVNVEAVP